MSFTGIILALFKVANSVMLLLLSFLAHSIIKFLSKRIQINPELIKTENVDQSDAENEVFLFNESSFVNLFDSSKFNSIVSDKNFTNLVEDSAKSFKLLDSDEDFYSELNEDNLKLIEMSGLGLYDDALLDSSIYSSPRYNSLFNSLASMDSQTKEIKDSDSIYGIENDVFFEDEKLINESLIESCTLTEERDFNDKSSYSDISEVLSSSSFEHITNSTPIQPNRKRKLTQQTEQSKPKKFLPKLDRNRNARRFYNRNSRTSSKKIRISSFNDTILHKMTKNLKLSSYKPSNKVEKLLNDSRGMRKYLIDYDGMMPEPRALTNLTYASLLNITNTATVYKSASNLSRCLRSISCTTRNRLRSRATSVSYAHSKTTISENNKLSCNRSSSGYLTDC